MTPDDNPPLHCRFCGQSHHAVALAPGERALCGRCDGLLAKGSRFGADGALAFAMAGLLLAVPACLLPFVSARVVGNERVSHLFTGASRLWDDQMGLLGIWVYLCGGLVPIALLSALIVLLLPGRLGQPPPNCPWLIRAINAFGYWAIPEVQVLAVLVALIKLDTLVQVTIEPGFWCYAAMSVALLLAFRSFEIELPEMAPASRRRAGARSP